MRLTDGGLTRQIRMLAPVKCMQRQLLTIHMDEANPGLALRTRTRMLNVLVSVRLCEQYNHLLLVVANRGVCA